jgi:hypothetical protein
VVAAHDPAVAARDLVAAAWRRMDPPTVAVL